MGKAPRSAGTGNRRAREAGPAGKKAASRKATRGANHRRSPAQRAAPSKKGGAPASSRGGAPRLLLAVAIGAILVALPLGLVLGWAVTPHGGKGGPVVLKLPRGASAGALGQRLEGSGVVSSGALMGWYLRLSGTTGAVKAGEHLVRDDLSPRQLVQLLARLPGRRAVTVTIPEGWHHRQVARRLERHGVCTARSFERAARNVRLLRRHGIRGESAEGYLFPATYQLPLDSDPFRLVAQLVGETRSRLQRLEAKHPGARARLRKELGWAEGDILTLASIVEKEAVKEDERARIAGVYVNRLTDPDFVPAGRLQADPTAAYGCVVEPDAAPSCDGFRGRVTPAMLRDASNRYNTYKHGGLPPGPIANPGAASIEAALAPERHRYLFFYATGGGRHTFSRSFEEHRRAIEGRRR